jgi:rubrerythrin
MHASRRQNGRLQKTKNAVRPNHYWQCTACGMKVKGTARQIEDTKRVHNCGLEDRPWASR